MITFIELREIFETYNTSSQFVIYSTKNRAVLGSAVGFEAAKDKAREIRQQRNLKFDDVSFMTTKRFHGGSTGQQGASSSSSDQRGGSSGSTAAAPKKQYGVSGDGRTYTNARGETGRVDYARNYNPSKGRRFRGTYDKDGNYADID